MMWKLSSRRIVGWAKAPSTPTNMVSAAIVMMNGCQATSSSGKKSGKVRKSEYMPTLVSTPLKSAVTTGCGV
jgi:hypothetical protein